MKKTILIVFLLLVQSSFSQIIMTSFQGVMSSKKVVAVPTATVPGAPTSPLATPGDAEATVSFTAPASNGGSAITGYTVTSSGGQTVSGASSPLTVTGLTNGTYYTFTVVATNAAGNSVASAASESIWAASEVITEINIENQSPTFYADGDIGTIDVTEPRLKYTNTNTNTNPNPNKINWYFYAPTTDITVAELKSIYYVASKTGKRAPFIFIYTKPTKTGDNSSWYKSRFTYERASSTSESDNSEYYAIAKATVKYGLPGLDLTKNYGGPDIVTGNELYENILYIGIGTDSSAPTGDYDFSLQEMGIEKKSGSREIFKFTTNSTHSTVPGAPTITAATAGNAEATVSFTAPTSDGGSAITGYTVTSSPGGFTATGLSSPLIVSGLTNGTVYTFTVVATNAAGNSVASAVSNTITPMNVVTEVTIDSQTWTTKNLDVATYSDDTVIPEVQDQAAWAGLTTGAWCYYNNDAGNNATYGKLYNWYAVAGIHDEASKTDASKRKKLAPTGYHVPTDTEWTTLTGNLGGEGAAGNQMKETGTTHWTEDSGATNSSGFTGLPGGGRDNLGSLSIGYYGFWWSSSEYGTTYALARDLIYYNGDATRGYANKNFGFSVRCLRD